MFGAVETTATIDKTDYKFVIAVGEVTKNSRNAILHSLDNKEPVAGVVTTKVAASLTTGVLSCADRYYYDNARSLMNQMARAVNVELYELPTKMVTFDTREEFNLYLQNNAIGRLSSAAKQVQDTIYVEPNKTYTMGDLMTAASLLAQGQGASCDVENVVSRFAPSDIKVVVGSSAEAKKAATLTKQERTVLLEALVDAYKTQFLTYQAARYKQQFHSKLEDILHHAGIEE